MNIKTSKKIMKRWIASTIVGLLLVWLLINSESNLVTLSDKLERIFSEYTVIFYFINALLLLLPAGILYLIGKKAYKDMIENEEEEVDQSVKKKAGYLDSAMTLLATFLVFNFLLYGMLYHKTLEDSSTVLVLFMAGITISSLLQVKIVKFIQSLDQRLKGDPTGASFSDTFVDSLDEAEQLRVYQSGYKAFKTTRTATTVIIVVSILMNIVFQTGGFPVLLSGVFMLVQTLALSYHEKKASLSH